MPNLIVYINISQCICGSSVNHTMSTYYIASSQLIGDLDVHYVYSIVS